MASLEEPRSARRTMVIVYVSPALGFARSVAKVHGFLVRDRLLGVLLGVVEFSFHGGSVETVLEWLQELSYSNFLCAFGIHRMGL